MQKGKKHACVETHLEVFLLNSKWWKNRWDHLPSVQVVLSTCTILSGTQSNGKFLPQKSTAFRHHVWQPICGLHLIKPGLRMAAENATPLFLKTVQGAIHMGPRVWSSFYSWKPPYYYSHAPISFSMLPLKLTMKTSSAEYKLLLLPLLGETQWLQAESQGIYMRFHLNVELLFLPSEKGAKSSGVKTCLQVEMKGGAWWAEIPQHEINKIYSYWGQNGNMGQLVS